MNINLTLDLSPAFSKAIDSLLVAFNSSRQEPVRITPPAPPYEPAAQGGDPTSGAEIASTVNQSLPVLTRWTEERKALLRREYPLSTDLPGLHQRLNALPGDSIPLENMRWWANRAGLANPSRRGPALRKPVAAPPAVVIQDEAAADATPVSTIASETPAGTDEPIAVDVARIHYWTEDRTAVLEFYYPAGDTLPAILARINAHPGPEISLSQLQAQIIHRQLKRSTVPAQVPSTAPKKSLGPVESDDASIRHWAAERGLCNGGEALDLVRVNAKRASLGLPAFVRRNGLRDSAATLRGPAQGDAR